MGIISNFDPRLTTTLTNIKLRHYFNFILTSYEAGFEKPDEKIFLQAMNSSKLKQLKPGECLHVGDQISLDYNGAKNSGWNAILINNTQEQCPNIDPTHVFDSLFGLHKHFVQTSSEKLVSHTL